MYSFLMVRLLEHYQSEVWVLDAYSFQCGEDGNGENDDDSQ